MKRRWGLLIMLVAMLSFGGGCAGTAQVSEAPPAPKVETRPAQPGPRAVWIDGHWAWKHGHYAWVSGHWERNPRGTWVPGHWDQRGRHYVWVAGHWRK